MRLNDTIHRSHSGRTAITTVRSRLAYLINSEWIHSAYWKGSDKEVIEKIKESLMDEKKKLHDRKLELDSAQSIIDEIDRTLKDGECAG